MINNPEVAAEIAALHERYEAALAANDVESLATFLWDSPHASQFGVNESLYGAREVSNFKLVTFGNDCAIVTLEFARTVRGVRQNGRQSQVWRRFEDGWKIVSTHVSVAPLEYLDYAAALAGLAIPAQYRQGVQQNLERAAAIARPLLEINLDHVVEAAPVFEP